MKRYFERDAELIRFRPLQTDDLPLMHEWLNLGFVLQWYGKTNKTLEQVTEHYTPYIRGEKPTHAFLIMHQQTPIGYIQAYMIRDYPEYARDLQVDDEAAGIDLFIGDENYIHKDLGSVIIRRFLSEFVFQSLPASCVVIGPEPKNRAAIRAYEKAGFTYLKTVQVTGEDEPEYLMRIENRMGVEYEK